MFINSHGWTGLPLELSDRTGGSVPQPHSPLLAAAMASLLQGYSSGEDDEQLATQDAFGLSSLPTSKKPRLEEPEASTSSTAVSIVLQAAPDVLAEVCRRDPSRLSSVLNV